MERKTAKDFPQELLDIFHLYQHGEIDRRAFFDRAQKFAVGGVTVATLWESLKPNYAWAEQVPESDSRIKAETVTVASPQGNGNIKSYLVRPSSAGTKKLPAIMVVHENRGLNPYVKDVARRLATEGYMALAPDGTTSKGGWPGNDEDGAKVFAEVDRDKMTNDFEAAIRWLKARPDCTGKVGAIGFCFGGGIVNIMAVRLGADLAAGVPFYGGQPSAEDAAKIKAPLLLNYADAKLDSRIGGGWPAFEAALKANGVKYEAYFYEGANHGFHNDTTPRYDEAAAKLAWTRANSTSGSRRGSLRGRLPLSCSWKGNTACCLLPVGIPYTGDRHPYRGDPAAGPPPKRRRRCPEIRSHGGGIFMNLQYIHTLYVYDQWANAQLLPAGCKLSQEQFTRNLDSSFPSVRDTLVHIISSQWIWLQRWKGNSLKRHFDTAPFPTCESIKSWLGEVEQEQSKFISALTQEQLSAPLSYLSLDGKPFAEPLWQQMTHRVNHSTYHRGQVTTMLRQLGANTVQLDMIAFYRQNPGA
jgi:carboxymethylenebutenolidase